MGIYDMVCASSVPFRGRCALRLTFLYRGFYQYYILNGQPIFDVPVDNARYAKVEPVNVEHFFHAE